MAKEKFMILEKNGKRILKRPKEGKRSEFLTACERNGYALVKEVKEPSLKRLETMSSDGIVSCPDGCIVEPDGTCPHGMGSWLIVLGFI